jgi:transposase
MMGERLVMQESLFYEFRLEDHVLSDHLLCSIDRFVDCSELRRHLAGSYSSTGRPSVDPERTESRKLLQATLDALSAHIAILDSTGTIIAVN